MKSSIYNFRCYPLEVEDELRKRKLVREDILNVETVDLHPEGMCYQVWYWHPTKAMESANTAEAAKNNTAQLAIALMNRLAVLMHKELKIIYQNHKPYGIRDDTGFLFFFAKISRFSDQDERYREEIEEQYKLADFLLSSLHGRTADNFVKPLSKMSS